MWREPSAVRDDQMRRRERRPLRKGDWKAVADAAIGQPQERTVATLHTECRNQVWNRRARAHDVAEANAAVGTGGEIARTAARQIGAHDADRVHAVMKMIERCALELLEPRRNGTAARRERRGRPPPQS